nr:hypothetical protein [Brachybacterium faecium]
MTATAASPAALPTPAARVGTSVGAEKKSWGYTVLGIARLMVGFTFLWAFLDKTFGLNFSTPAEGSWLNGGSPTAGFLGGSIAGGNPFSGPGSSSSRSTR